MDEFTRQYLETALWSSTDESTPKGGEPMDRNYDVGDIAPEAIEQAQRDCDAFRARAGDMLDEHDDETYGAHDFWLTRNGHGAGFWDGGWPEHGDALTHICETFGVCEAYVGDDGLIYFA